jgi:acetamidase/formamidase
MNGPVAVRGAKAGQVLEVRIKAIDLNYDWGYNLIRPLAGALPDDFANTRLIHIPLDRARMVGRLPWGLELPLKPFFGVMVVAPLPAWGPVPSPPPRRNGGNMDNKELVAGTTLYLPIHVDGALFSVGDGHGVQGDGEVCITAIETGLIGTFELHVRDDMTQTRGNIANQEAIQTTYVYAVQSSDHLFAILGVARSSSIMGSSKVLLTPKTRLQLPTSPICDCGPPSELFIALQI